MPTDNKVRKPDHRLKITLTDTERDQLKILAKATGKSLATTLRESAFSKMKNYAALISIQPDLEKIIYEAGMQGNNLNQMARKLNAMNKTDNPSREIFDAIETARTTAEQLNDIRMSILEIIK